MSSTKRKLSSEQEDNDFVVEKEESLQDQQESEVLLKKGKIKSAGTVATNCEVSFDLGNKRRVTVSKYKGALLINLREFYEDKGTGELKPGSKGIALNVEQWKALGNHVDEINCAIKDMS